MEPHEERESQIKTFSRLKSFQNKVLIMPKWTAFWQFQKLFNGGSVMPPTLTRVDLRTDL